MNVLVGYTGFVGSNLYRTGKFDAVYHSKNIKKAYGTNPNFLVYAGLRAEKYLANHAPSKDMESIYEAENNIANIHPKKLVLISTIDVLGEPKGADERTEIDAESLCAYGRHRYMLELWVREHYSDALIVRLPALYGKNLKKNFLYDFIHLIPSMLKKEKMEELVSIDGNLKQYYILQENGFYKVKELNSGQKKSLIEIFRSLGFSALNFTDSRSVFQFYDLSRLWKDILRAMAEHITLWHPAVAPVSAGELYTFLTGEVFQNELDTTPAYYDYRTIYDTLFGGSGGYICTKEEVLTGIQKFVEEERIS